VVGADRLNPQKPLGSEEVNQSVELFVVELAYLDALRIVDVLLIGCRIAQSGEYDQPVQLVAQVTEDRTADLIQRVSFGVTSETKCQTGETYSPPACKAKEAGGECRRRAETLQEIFQRATKGGPHYFSSER